MRMAKPNKSKSLAALAVTVLSFSVFISSALIGIFLPGPYSASAQTSTVGQTVDSSAGALTFPCDLDTTTFTFDPIEINSPDTVFYSYYTNPKTPYTDLTICDGSGLTVQDTRYSGGFVLQVNATDYTATNNPANKIDITNLAFVTEQANTSYSEDATGTSAFVGSGDTKLTGSDDDEAEIEYALPFDFEFYGTTYNTVYLCSNGIINFDDTDGNATLDTDGSCSPASATVFEDPTGEDHILPYYKDLNLNFGANPAYGIYYTEYTTVGPGTDTVRFRWFGETANLLGELVEFEVILFDDDEEDTITFNYASVTELTDTDTTNGGPQVGVTKGGAATPPLSATYTESYFSESSQGADLVDGQAVFKSGFDFTEVKKPGTPAAEATYNGNPSQDIDFEALTDGDDDGTSDAFNLIYGHVTPSGPFTPGRIGLYTIYPSFRLAIPNGESGVYTADGTYENTITFTLQDSTF